MVSIQAKADRSQKLTTNGPASRRREGDRKVEDCGKAAAKLMTMRIFPWMIALSVASCMKAPDPVRAMGPTPNPEPTPAAAPRLIFHALPDWKEVPSAQEILLAAWELPKNGIANVSFMGNRPELKNANLQRWAAQFDTPEEPRIEQLKGESHYPITVIEVSGTLTQTRQVGGGDPRGNWALLGAVVETAQGPVYLKVLGPQENIQAQRTAVLEAIRKLDFVQ